MELNLTGKIEIDVHGMTVKEAVNMAQAAVKKAGNSVYRIRIIHGYHGGTKIREAINRELGYGLEPRVKRITQGENPGVTELILREYY